MDINVAVFTGFDPDLQELGQDPEEALQAMCAMFSRLSDSQYQRAVVNIDGALHTCMSRGLCTEALYASHGCSRTAAWPALASASRQAVLPWAWPSWHFPSTGSQLSS